MLKVFYKQGNLNFETYIRDGFCVIKGTSIENLEKKFPGAQCYTYEEAMRMLVETQDKLCGQWIEISEDNYEILFESLPPIMYQSIGGIVVFRISDSYTSNIRTTVVKNSNGKFYKAYFRDTVSNTDVLNHLAVFLSVHDIQLEKLHLDARGSRLAESGSFRN